MAAPPAADDRSLEARPDVDWRQAAACIGRAEVFFGTHNERPSARERREAEARRICEACPVLRPCRDEARRNREEGFWGGESERERAALGYGPSRQAVDVGASRRRVPQLPDAPALLRRVLRASDPRRRG